MDERIHHQHLSRIFCDVDETVQHRSEAVVLVSVCSVKCSYLFQVDSRLTNAAAVAAAAAAAVHFCIHKHHVKYFKLKNCKRQQRKSTQAEFSCQLQIVKSAYKNR